MRIESGCLTKVCLAVLADAGGCSVLGDDDQAVEGLHDALVRLACGDHACHRVDVERRTVVTSGVPSVAHLQSQPAAAFSNHFAPSH